MNYVLRSPIFQHNGRKQFMASLWEGDRNVLSMVFDEILQTARLESGGIKRLFMLYKEGKRHPKIIFKNEYGFDLGSIDASVDANGFGKMEMLGNKYVYHLPQKDSEPLSVHQSADEQPLANIITDTPSNNGTGQPIKLSLDYFYRLLVGICWHLQLPIKNSEIFTASVTNTPRPSISV